MNNPGSLNGSRDRRWFEEIYAAYNRKEFVSPDPLEFVLRYDSPSDQEIAGIIAATLAFGRVRHILKSLEGVFEVLENPASNVDSLSERELKEVFGSFRHRWTTGEELACLLIAVKRLRREYGSLETCFSTGIGERDTDVIPALKRFVGAVMDASGLNRSSLLSCPSGGSACKRLLLYLRWMVRKDEVDPGPWEDISPSMLIVPMDTHMHRFAKSTGLVSRKQADMKSALELTSYFRKLCPEDPVRYDFSLTRPGIWGVVRTEKGFVDDLKQNGGISVNITQ